MNRVFGVAVPKVILDQPQIIALVGKEKAARVPQQMGMERAQSGPSGGGANEVVDGLPGHRLPALGHEQPRQGVVPSVQVAFDRPQPERTREGLAKARASGKKLGRPKGSLGVSRLDGKEDEIRHFLGLGVSKNAIAKITGVSRPTLYHFIGSRGLPPNP